MTVPVSVVIPAYNAERYLKDAVDSVLRQTVTPLEILVVDDGSTDGTGRLAEAIPGVRCIHQENGGVSVARNRGIEESRGLFVALLDVDDVWEPPKLAQQSAAFREGHFAFSARTETDERLNPIRVVKGGHAGSLLEGLLFHGNVVGTPSSVVAPRDALLDLGGFDPELSMCADWDMWIRLVTRLSGVYSGEPLVRYRIHEGSMSTNLPKYEWDAMHMLRKAFELSLPAEIMERRAEAESRMWEVLAGCYWDQASVGNAFRCALQSIGRRPSRLAALAVSVPYRMARRALGSTH